GPSLVWEGPDLRRVYARIDQADAISMQAAALYEQAVLDALADAESALSDYALELERRADLVIAAAAARRALDLATLRFQEGLDDYLDVLDAQRTLLDAEDRLATSQAETASRAIRAYRALGGVWDDPALVDFRNSQTGGT
ncbi:MAG: TolC family protein, partial [Pseudomonadota bacterium]